VHRHLAAAADAGVDADARSLRLAQQRDPAWARQEVLGGILRVDAALDGVPARLHRRLVEPQPLARRDPQLRVHEIDSGHPLGDRMFDLKACVHLQEVEAAVVGDEELHGAGVGVADTARRGDRGGGEAVAQRRAHHRRWGFLDDLLVPSLDRALALAEMHGGAVLISEDLDLDVMRPIEVALEEDAAVSERR
jgi:hypothetical protein